MLGPRWVAVDVCAAPQHGQNPAPAGKTEPHATHACAAILEVAGEATEGPASTCPRRCFGAESVAEPVLWRRRGGSVTKCLGVSSHTVRHHAEWVFTKLGIHSREALALKLMTDHHQPTAPGQL